MAEFPGAYPGGTGTVGLECGWDHDHSYNPNCRLLYRFSACEISGLAISVYGARGSSFPLGWRLLGGYELAHAISNLFSRLGAPTACPAVLA